MIKSFIVDKTCESMRIDKYLRINIGKFPQSLIEKSLRNGKVIESDFLKTINEYIK